METNPAFINHWILLPITRRGEPGWDQPMLLGNYEDCLARAEEIGAGEGYDPNLDGYRFANGEQAVLLTSVSRVELARQRYGEAGFYV